MKFAALHLHEQDPQVDAEVRRWVMPHQAVPLIYEGMLEEIRDEMDDQPYAFMFTYDWRKDNRLAAEALANFIDRVLLVSKTHEKKAGRPAPRQVVLIGHSMGGLVIKWCAVKNIPYRRKIAKIITIATPFKGSLKAVEALLPGARNWFGVETMKSMRHASRTMPGIYQLLPNWDRAIVDDQRPDAAPANMDPFDVNSWQTNLVENLANRFSADYFPSMLADARRFSDAVSKPWPVELQRKVYSAYGVGSKTWKQVRVDTRKGNLYLFKEADEDDKGDGTVHSLSSRQPEIGGSHGYEDPKHAFKDQLTGQHANMPNHSGLQDWVLRILKLNVQPGHSFESPN